MTTIYTVNNKVLKNSANDKWLIKKEAPAGFVMNGSDAIIRAYGPITKYVSWQSPAYPDIYNGNGKQYVLVNNNDTIPAGLTVNNLMYAESLIGGGPTAIDDTDMRKQGTSTGTLQNNDAGAGGYGVYLSLSINGELEQVQAYMANVSITIVDP